MPFPPKTLLRVERLEERTLLSVSAAEYAEIRAAYADFGLSENMADVNIIEIESANLALAHLKAAITTAGTTAGDDLIVVRTTDSANTITYTDTSDEITIHINSTTYGKLNIVGFGTKSLTLNAAQKSRVINITAGTVHLGNLTVTGGVASHGGGIYNFGQLNISQSSIIGNFSFTSCGGIYNSGTASLAN